MCFIHVMPSEEAILKKQLKNIQDQADTLYLTNQHLLQFIQRSQQAVVEIRVPQQRLPSLQEYSHVTVAAFSDCDVLYISLIRPMMYPYLYIHRKKEGCSNTFCDAVQIQRSRALWSFQTEIF